MGKFLGIKDIRTSLNGLEKCEILTRQELAPTRRDTPGWSGPKDQQNKTDKFLSVFGAMYVIVNSPKGKGKALKKHILKDPRIEEIQEKHNQQTTQLQQAITDRDNQIQVIRYENVALQKQRNVYQIQLQRCEDTITHLRERYVDHVRDPGKDNIIIIVRKHTTSANDKYHDLPYYVTRIQRRKSYVKLRWFDRHFLIMKSLWR